ncbi:hypothetical protein JCM10449v2_001995 [Rhodotorula kratochvilovae]
MSDAVQQSLDEAQPQSAPFPPTSTAPVQTRKKRCRKKGPSRKQLRGWRYKKKPSSRQSSEVNAPHSAANTASSSGSNPSSLPSTARDAKRQRVSCTDTGDTTEDALVAASASAPASTDASTALVHSTASSTAHGVKALESFNYTDLPIELRTFIVKYVAQPEGRTQVERVRRQRMLKKLAKLGVEARSFSRSFRAETAYLGGAGSLVLREPSAAALWIFRRRNLEAAVRTQLHELVVRATGASRGAVDRIFAAFPVLAKVTVVGAYNVTEYFPSQTHQGLKHVEIIGARDLGLGLNTSFPNVKRLAVVASRCERLPKLVDNATFPSLDTLVINSKSADEYTPTYMYSSSNSKLPSTITALALSGPARGYYKELVGTSRLEYLHLALPLEDMSSLLGALSTPLRHLSISFSRKGQMKESFKDQQVWQPFKNALEYAVDTSHLAELETLVVVGDKQLGSDEQVWLDALIGALKFDRRGSQPLKVVELVELQYDPLEWYPRSGQYGVPPNPITRAA